MKSNAEKIAADMQDSFLYLLSAHRSGIKPSHYQQIRKMIQGDVDLRTEMSHAKEDWPKGYSLVGGFPKFVGLKPRAKRKK